MLKKYIIIWYMIRAKLEIQKCCHLNACMVIIIIIIIKNKIENTESVYTATNPLWTTDVWYFADVDWAKFRSDNK